MGIERAVALAFGNGEDVFGLCVSSWRPRRPDRRAISGRYAGRYLRGHLLLSAPSRERRVISGGSTAQGGGRATPGRNRAPASRPSAEARIPHVAQRAHPVTRFLADENFNAHIV